MHLISTTDLADESKYKVEGQTGPEQTVLGEGFDDKDALLHPDKIDGKYALFHRVGKDIQVAYAEDLNQFKDQYFWREEINDLENTVLMKNKPGTWEYKLGGGPPPIKVGENEWLKIYHSSDKTGKGRQYRAGIALLGLNESGDKLKTIARSPDPLMEPETDFEKNGTVPGVVFPQGLMQKGDNLLIYYGAGDSNVGVAQTSLSELVDYVKQYDSEGNAVKKGAKKAS